MAQTGRKGRSAPAQRRSRSGGGNRPRFGAIALTLALPLLAFAGYWLYSGWSRKETPPATEGVSRAASLPEIAPLLQRSGVEPGRMKRVSGGFEVESLLSPETIAERLRKRIDGTVDVNGDSVIVTRGEAVERIRVRRLATSDSGAGLVETEEGEAAVPPGSPAIALIIDDVGFGQQPLEEVTAIGVPLSFAILPYTSNGEAAARLLASRGFEVLCHLPMEPEGYPKVRPGSGAVLTSMSDDEVYATALASIRSVPGAKGVNNHMGSRASADPRVMGKVVEAIRATGGFFVDSRTTSQTVGASTARAGHIRFASRDVFLDDDRDEGKVREQLARLAALAEKNGSAVGIAHLHPSTLRVLQEELPRLRARGFRFVHASEVVNGTPQMAH